VYRRRRLTALVGLLAVVATVWLLIAQPWRGEASDRTPEAAPTETTDAASALPVPSTNGTPTPTPTPTPTIRATPKSTPSAATTPSTLACTEDDVLVEAVTDKQSYNAGENPQLSIRLTNTGDVPCTLNVGTTKQVFTITSGDDVWWRSTDCQTEPSDMIVTLAAGQKVSSATPLAWDRTRSSVSTCGHADRPKAPGGGASYHLSVEIGGVASLDSAQILLY
jgi:hypothetical protein